GGGSRLLNNEWRDEDRGRGIRDDSPGSTVRCYSTRGALRVVRIRTSSSFLSWWHGLFCSRLGSWRAFIIVRIYELQRTDSAVLRALQRDAAILESLRHYC